MAKSPSKSESTEIQIQPLRRASVRLRLIGLVPMYQNRMAKKVKEYLLVGGRKKTAVEKLEVKHNPLLEYRDAAEIMRDGPTAIGIRCDAVKKSMAGAALETPGITQTSAKRLIYLPGDRVSMWGVPQLKMDVVRSADMNRTPDVRTRPFFPQWAAEIEVRYIVPQLSTASVVTLACNGGLLFGLGDNRIEKGGAYGAFRVIGADQHDDEWDQIVKHQGRKAQLAALETPVFADDETAELYKFFQSEVKRRAPGTEKPAKTKAPKKTNGAEVRVSA